MNLSIRNPRCLRHERRIGRPVMSCRLPGPRGEIGRLSAVIPPDSLAGSLARPAYYICNRTAEGEQAPWVVAMDIAGEFAKVIGGRGFPLPTAAPLHQILARPPPTGIRQQYPQRRKKQRSST